MQISSETALDLKFKRGGGGGGGVERERFKYDVHVKSNTFVLYILLYTSLQWFRCKID